MKAPECEPVTLGSPLAKNLSSELSINVYCPEDKQDVLRLQRQHVHSLTLPSMQYYVMNHCYEIMFILLFGFCQNTFILNIFNISFFTTYLWIRARYEISGYLRQHCNDLDDIRQTYIKPSRANFWVAKLDNEVVGFACIVKQPGSDRKTALMTRLVVDSNCRRHRIGSRLYETLEQFAKMPDKEFDAVVLNTSSLSKAHIDFVASKGFSLIVSIPRNMMRGNLLKWRKNIKTETQLSPASDGTDMGATEFI